MGCSNDNYWKLDKWDKIGIASLIIFFTIFVVLNTFCFGAENSVPVTNFDGYSAIAGERGDFISTGPNANGYYFPVVSGHTYNISVSSNQSRICYTKEKPALNVEVFDFDNIGNFKEFTIQPGEDGYLFLFIYNYGEFSINVVDMSVGFNGVVSGLVVDVGISFLWDIFNKSIPYILVVVLISFGIYLVSHAIKEISKGRDV